MPKNLKRYYGLGHLHFITFSCHRRLALLETVRARNVFVRSLQEARVRDKFALLDYVVTPDRIPSVRSQCKAEQISARRADNRSMQCEGTKYQDSEWMFTPR